MEMVTRRIERIAVILLTLALLVTSGPVMSVMSMNAFAVNENEAEMNESVSENESVAEEDADAQDADSDGRASYEAAKEDEPEAEEATAGESFEAGKLTAGSDDYEISLDYDADAEIPGAASLDVKEISSNTKEYSEYVETAADEVTDKHIEADSLPYARFFDISILNEDGDEIEPAAPVSVSIELKDKALDTEDVEFAAVHFTDDKNNQAETVPVEIKNEELSFEAGSFSVYGVVYYYTVDFYYTSKDNKASEHHMNGGSEMMLSELFDKLDITRKTADIKKVDFTDDSLLSFTDKGNDYLIKSLKAFTSGEVLTITFNDGEIIVIRVEDDVDVTDWSSLKAAVEAGDTQTITLTSDITAGNDTITVPDGAEITIAGNYKITRNASESSDVKAMFTVNGKLTLQNVTLSGGNAEYRKAMINSKTRGFFVEVNESGTLNIEGAKLQDYKTPETSADIPVGVSPVYVKGSFNMKSGSISNNEAGAWWKLWFEDNGTVASINNSVKENSSLKDDNEDGINPNGYVAVEKLASKSVLSRTNSGAIFFDGPDAKYTIDGSADISNNKGHAGAIVVAGGQLTIKGNATISNNYGDHDSTIFVASSDAEVRMCGGLLQSNKSTNGGGVLAADEGKFFLMGGTIYNNYSYNTGGGVLVYSNNVHIISGKITNNKSAVFGGGIYVYGEDSGQASFATVISSADIRNNRAVYTEGMYATSDSRAAGIISGDGNVTIKGDEEFARGSGGGIWLCPAGIATFDMTSVNLQGNTAEHQNDDFHKDAGFLGGVLIDFGPHDRLTGWKHDEASVRSGGSAEQFTEAEATSGQAAMFGLKNEGQTYVQNPKVEISENASRRGGGIGSDGTVLFFTPDGENINIDKGSLSYEKTFVDMDSDKMEYEMILADKDGKPELNDDGDEIVVAQFRLYDKDYADTYETKRHTFGSDIYGQGKAEWENNYQKINIEFPKGNDDANFITETDDGAEFNIIMREYKVKDDNTRGAEVSERFFSSDDPKFEKKTDNEFETITYYQDAQGCDGTDDCNCDPGEPKTFKIYKRKFNFSATATNMETPEIEKYVNEAVHSDIALQDEFTYNILAYVTTNADKVVITDKLNEQLEFVSDASDVKVYDLGTKEENGQEVPIDSNHLPVYDVSGDKIDHKGVTPSVQTGKAITIKNNEYSKVDRSDDTLTVTLANELNDDGSRKDVNQELKDLYGHYIRIEFKAKIKSNLSISELEYNEIKAGEEYKDGVNGEERGKPYTGNDPVKSDEDHTGIINAASYAINVGNVAKYQDSSNTVTVKPEEPAIEKYVNHAVHKDIALDEIFTYDILAYVTNNADSVIITDTLAEDLEFADTENISVSSIDSNNHKPEKDINNNVIASDASVAESGSEISSYSSSIEGKKLTVTLNDVKDLRGKWIKVTFQAQIKKSIQDDIKAGTKTLADLSDVEISENNPVLSNEDHSGISNNAFYEIKVKNESKYVLDTNIVTVKPDQPEIEKYVNQAVHDYIDLDEEFTYDVIAYITRDADTVTIEDTLDDQLEFTGGISDVKVVDLGKSNNHKPVNDIYSVKIHDDATVAESGSSIDNAQVATEGNKLSVNIPDASKLRGNWVKVTFKAKIKSDLGIEDLNYTEIDPADAEERDAPNVGNDPVASKERHDGVPNKASYKIGVGIVEDRHSDESNTVTVKPEKPEIEKFVDQAVHKDINIDDEFTYDIVAYVTDDAATVKITDELDKQLQFVSTEKDVKVADLGNTNNHKVTNDIAAVKVNDDASVAEEGDKITDAKVSINGNKLVVDIPEATAYRGHWVKVTFKAKIADGKKVQDLKYTEIKDADEEKRGAPNIGNDPVISDEDHKGVPNNASYEIGVKNSAGIVETKYDDESNTVTVKPDEIPVYFSKKELDGDELEGAKIVVKDEEGNVIEEWISTTESHRIDLKPGKYSMQEVVAPEGFQRVTTTIWFEVNEDGKVTLLTAEVDNGGKISIMDADHIILEDAPVKNPLLTIKKTSKTTSAMPGDVIDYVITIENSGDGDAEDVEVVDTMDDNLTYVSDNSDGVADGQSVTWIVDVAAGKTKTIKIKCRVDEDAAGKVINKAEITNYETEFVDNGDDEHDVVLGKYKNKDSGSNSKSKTRGARTGDETQIVLWSITLLLTMALVVVLRIRRRYQR